MSVSEATAITPGTRIQVNETNHAWSGATGTVVDERENETSNRIAVRFDEGEVERVSNRVRENNGPLGDVMVAVFTDLFQETGGILYFEAEYLDIIPVAEANSTEQS